MLTKDSVQQIIRDVEVAKGKYVLLLNNDTILFENSIKKVFDFAESLEWE